MNLETAMDLGLASGSIQDDIAASLNLNKTKQEPVKMATVEETNEAGFTKFMSWFGNKLKAAADEDEKKEDEPEEAKAEGDEDPEKEEAKAEGDDEKKDDDAKAESDGDEDPEKEEMKARIESLETELAETKAKAQSEDEEKALLTKVDTILTAMSDKKITMHTARTLFSKSTDDVSAALSDLSANATGRGKTEEPKAEALTSKLESWQAMKSENNHGAAQKFYNKHSNEIRSEMSKEK